MSIVFEPEDLTFLRREAEIDLRARRSLRVCEAVNQALAAARPPAHTVEIRLDIAQFATNMRRAAEAFARLGTTAAVAAQSLMRLSGLTGGPDPADQARSDPGWVSSDAMHWSPGGSTAPIWWH